MGPNSFREVGFTLFVDNLPTNMNNSWLRQIFKFDGEVVDVFVSRKQRRFSKLAFGFVRFKIKMDAERAIVRNDDLKIRGVGIKVGWAKYVERGFHGFKRRQEAEMFSRGWGREPLLRPASRDKQNSLELKWKGCEDELREENQAVKWPACSESNDFKRKVCVARNNENVEWLSRSIIGDTDYPITLEALKSKIYADWPSILKVRDMGGFRFILTFESIEEAEEVLNDENCLLKEHFVELKAWSICEVGLSRRTWIECYGIPPHGWSSESLHKIGELWGDVICFDYMTEKMESLGTARIQIETNVLKFINEKIQFMVEDSGFVVFVRETSVASVLFNKTHADIRREAISSMKSSELPGTPMMSSSRCADEKEGNGPKNQIVEEEQGERVNCCGMSNSGPLTVETGTIFSGGESRSTGIEEDGLSKKVALVPMRDDGVEALEEFESLQDPIIDEVVPCSFGGIELTVDLCFGNQGDKGEVLGLVDKGITPAGPIVELDVGCVEGNVGKNFEPMEEIEQIDYLVKEMDRFDRKVTSTRKVGRPKKHKKKEKCGVQKGKKNFQSFCGDLNHSRFDEWDEDDDEDDDREGDTESEARNTWTLGKALGLSSLNEEEVVGVLRRSKRILNASNGSKKDR